jgi:indolepyruvate ferredoxin oxidoreductase alpha subunit
MHDHLLLSGNEAVALAARHAGFSLGCGYPGTPSTEILESFRELGGHAEWSPNEKVALEVALGASYGHGRVLATMKHVGLNVAADVLFTAALTDCPGALIVVSADDPGMASSQNEQDNRRYATAAAVPMLEPSDSQDAYDLFLVATEISERWRLPVLFRMTTRVCHSKGVVRTHPPKEAPPATTYERNIQGRVRIPAFARPAHPVLRAKLAEIAAWGETSGLHRVERGTSDTGIVTSGVPYLHAREAAPEASILKLSLTHPLPEKAIKEFAASVKTCRVVEEGDPYLVEALRCMGLPVPATPIEFRFGELNVELVRKLLSGDKKPKPVGAPGRPPRLCDACPHINVFEVLRKLGCIVAGDIGCYTLGVLPPYEAMDMMVCMGASIGMGLGLRHVLPRDQAKRVVSVIGDSTFIHSGLTGMAEMVYNPPTTGHVLIILDNETTAMTGHQEHPGTGRDMSHQSTGHIVIEEVAKAMGIRNIHVVDPFKHQDEFERLVSDALIPDELTLIIARRPCVLVAGQIRSWKQAVAEGTCHAT